MAIVDSLENFLCLNQYGFSAVGIAIFLFLLLKVLRITFEIVTMYVLPDRDLKQYGRWAIVTGSTDGIGKSYARQLAKRKVDLILISRNCDKLATMAEEIERDFKVTVKTIQADFTLGWELHQRIKDQLAEEEIGILVNNVGLVDPQPCHFLCLKQKEILDLINVNVTSLLLLNAIVLPRMIQRRNGVIVNVSSMASVIIMSLQSQYGACKSLVSNLCQALYWENRYSGVYVQTLIPSFVTTKMISYSNIWKYFRLFVPDADTYSRSAVRILGQIPYSTGYWNHLMQHIFAVKFKLFAEYTLFWLNLYFIRNRSPD